MILVVDYGMGNVGSLLNMFKRIGVDACIGATPSAILGARKLLLPGVGAFDAAMQRINSLPGLRDALEHKVLTERVPVLGVCLGMQLLGRSSEEGQLPGLGWLCATTRRFPSQGELKVPHMGWNLARASGSSALTQNLPEEPRFYFVHSYFMVVDNPVHSIMRTTHGVTFDSAVQNDNIYGAQFHPEKSQKFGMQLLKNFAEL